MKKLLCLILACFLLISCLSGCGTREDEPEAQPGVEGNFAPENTAVPNSSVQDAASAFSGGVTEEQPTLEPAETIDAAASEDEAELADDAIFGTYDAATDTAQHAAPSNIDTSAYQFTSLSDHSLGFTFSYPAHWKNIPGIYTVCFQEDVEQGDFPARVAITRNKLTHTPKDAAIVDHLVSYLKTIYKQYDTAAFEVSGLDRTVSFMGQPGYSTTYLAFSGETEVEGFVIMCAVERTLYVFHFSASYSDYQSMQSMMQYMLNSVTLAS